eukprot:CAMPEP_0119328118 /NCGR_PEP_ID=MMETSP1333-20130426/72499_1 /TAXON_ID=418940 /ORGANISM="Scyphosphaera apsteinii, Strain RCC1455" /LENGTH=310 /DNA_ID=CAMNT_0007336885 /DNA_START=13 /DNA_END=945 /DNA_ORIENTATION=+
MKKPKRVAKPTDDAEEHEQVAASRSNDRQRPTVSNQAALALKLIELTGGVDAEISDDAWLETLAITATKPLEIEDPEDDLKRELAFYHQALGAVHAAQMKMDRLGVPYRRPDDYFAEMVKSDKHMTKVKKRMITEQQAILTSEERRKQRTAKKFGKQVQTAKLQERAQQRKAAAGQVQNKRNSQAPEFDIELDEEAPQVSKRARDRAQGAGAAKRFKGEDFTSKREAKEARYGKHHRDKRNTADSTADIRDFNRDRVGKGGGKGVGKANSQSGGKGRGKGGGGKGGGGKGAGKGARKARPGKDKRKSFRN